MRLVFSVLVFCYCYEAVIATADLASSYDLPHYFNPYHDSNPQAFRTIGLNLGGLNLAFPRATSTGVRILTSTFTCTLSVSSRCGVRATVGRPGKVRVRPGRPAVSAVIPTQALVIRDNIEEDLEEQFPIAPSAVQGVEATPLPTRDARAADPQRFMTSPAFRYQPQDIQSAFESDPYESAMSLPFHRRYYALPGQQRQMPMPPFIQSLFALTRMTTSFKIATFTFTPSCSVAGSIPQCPNGK